MHANFSLACLLPLVAASLIVVPGIATAATLSISDVTDVEGSTPGATGRRDFVFTLTLDEVAAGDVVIDWQILPGGGPFPADLATDIDVPSLTGTRTIPAGEMVETIVVPVVEDTDWENTEWFRIEIDVTGAEEHPTDNRGVGQITNDDLYLTVVGAGSPYEGNAAPGGDCTFSIGVRGCATPPCTPALDIELEWASVEFVHPITQLVSALADVDFEVTSGQLLFSAGLPANDVQVTVPIIGDTIYEATERFDLELVTVANASGIGVTGDCQIVNDDPRFTIGDYQQIEGDAGATTFSVPITLRDCVDSDDCYDQDLSVQVLTAGTGYWAVGGNDCAEAGIDYLFHNQIVTIAAGSNTANAAFTVCGDANFELNERFDLTLANASNHSIHDDTAFVTILNDDDVPTVSIDDVSVVEGNNGDPAYAVFTVSLSATSWRTFKVYWDLASDTATAGTDYYDNGGFVSFSDGDTSKTFAVTVWGDAEIEGDESFWVDLTVDSAYATLVDGRAVGTIIDDDAPLTVSIADTSAVEQDPGGGSSLVFPVTLNHPSDDDVSVSWAVTGGTATLGEDYVILDPTVVIPAGETDSHAIVALVNDWEVEDDETVEVTLSDPVGATIEGGHAVGTIIDNDEPIAPIGLPDTYTTVARLDGGPTLEIDASHGVLVNDVDGDGGPLSAQLVTPPSFGEVLLRADGGFTYTPDPGFHGDAWFEYLATDGQADTGPTEVRVAVGLARVVGGDGDTDSEGFDVPHETFSASSHLTFDGFAACSPSPSGASAAIPGAPTTTGEWTAYARTDAPAQPLDPGVILAGEPIDGIWEGTLTFTGGDTDTCGHVVAYYEVGHSPAEALQVQATLEVWFAASDATSPGEPALEVSLRADDGSGAGFSEPIALGTVTTDALLSPPPGGGATPGNTSPYRAAFNSGPIDGPWPIGTLFELRFAGVGDAVGWVYGIDEVTLDTATENPPPVAEDDMLTVDEGQTLATNLLINDSDPDGDALAAVLVAGPSEAVTFVLGADGSLTYTPRCGCPVADELTYLVNDGALDSEPATVTIDITSILSLLNALADDVRGLATPARTRLALLLPLRVAIIGYKWARFADAARALHRFKRRVHRFGSRALISPDVVEALVGKAERVRDNLGGCAGL